MIHFTCDCCKRALDSESDLRYIVRVEVYASLDPVDEGSDDDRDHLQEIQDILEQVDQGADGDLASDVYHHARYDLCSECRKKYVQNPLGRPVAQQLDFSQN